MDVRKLVRMANQIAENFDYGRDEQQAVDNVLDHLRRFWTPDMKTLIVEYSQQQQNDLSQIAAIAVAGLQQEQVNAV